MVTLKIDGPCFPIRVKFVSRDTVHKRARPTKGTSADGHFDPNKNEIVVVKDLPVEEREHILLHELVHAMEYQVSGQEEETRVDTIANWLKRIAPVIQKGILPT